MDRWANDRVGMSEIPLFNTVGKLEARCPAWSLISQRDTSAMAAAANNNTDPVGDELAALAAIYGSDYEALPPKAASAFQPLFRLRLTPVTGGSDVDNRVTCTLTVQLPKRYPKSSIVPTVTIESATLDKAQLSALTDFFEHGLHGANLMRCLPAAVILWDGMDVLKEFALSKSRSLLPLQRPSTGQS